MNKRSCLLQFFITAVKSFLTLVPGGSRVAHHAQVVEPGEGAVQVVDEWNLKPIL
jgi:hypothetical protein